MSTIRVVEQIRAARDARMPLRIEGSGTWMGAGRPVRNAETLSLASDRGIVEYVPGDLTLTARAGTTFAEIEQATQPNGQWLPLAPWGSPQATLGATISTGTAGPYAAAFGLPRDAALGLEFVTGTGDVVRSGGRVVKNVAGFDLTRLLTGSWGTLGVVTEITVRLRALPQQSRTFAIPVSDSASALASLAADIRALPFAPFVCELVNAAMARFIDVGEGTTLLLQLGGNEASLSAQLEGLSSLGRLSDVDTTAIERLKASDANAVASWRLSARPTRFADIWTAASSDDDALVHGSIHRGSVRVVRSSCDELSAVGPIATTFERLPPQLWSAVPERSSSLSERIRSRFDPDGILNPGILGRLA